jgi:hypothetical protein
MRGLKVDDLEIRRVKTRRHRRLQELVMVGVVGSKMDSVNELE